MLNNYILRRQQTTRKTHLRIVQHKIETNKPQLQQHTNFTLPTAV